jgi:small subunit ribosomal protein S17
MRIFTGKVISTKRSKTVSVAVESVFVHPIYKKRFRRLKKYSVHDEKGVKVGDRVKFIASRPYSKTVKWNIIEVLLEKGGKK